MNFRWGVIAAISLLVTGILVGILAPEGVVSLLARDLAALRELSSTLGPFKLTTAVIIFTRNLTAVWLSFIFSPLLCVLPVISLLTNGFLLAYIGSTVVEQRSLGFLLAGILPHGIFELPALVIGEAAAITFGVVTIMALVWKSKRPLWMPALKKSLRYLIIASVLLLPAAVIETFITPLLIR